MKNKGIYYLLNDDKIVYIGKSLSNMKTRVDSHLKDEAKEFDSVLYHYIDNDSDINILEVAMIAKHSPIYNNDCVTSDNSTIDNLNIEDFTLEKTVITDLEKRVVKNIAIGFKMYNQGIESIIENFTKGESLKIIRMFDSERVNRFNILNLPFKDYTEDMHTTDRSKFKKKLIDNGVICEHNKLMMLNPYMFVPRGTKDIINCNYLTQQVWTYLFEDLNKDNELIINHAKLIFGTDAIRESKYIKVGNKKSEEQSKIIEKPNNKNS